MRGVRGFTLVEILIVVVLLGVLAAIVVPTIGRSTTTARETTLVMDLNLLRRFIPIYASQHLEVPPGYPDGDQSAAPTSEAFVAQATLSSTVDGRTAPRGTPGFPFGPYLSRIPVNPLNKQDGIQVLADGEAFPAEVDGTDGWIFKPETGEIRPGNSGIDGFGKPYYDY